MARKNPRQIQQFEVSVRKDNGHPTTEHFKRPDPKHPRIHGYQNDQYILDNYLWEPNCIFQDEVEFTSCHASRGSAHFYFKSLITGREFFMFMSDFEDIMKSKKLIDGNKLKGEFTFCKKGWSQGFRMIIE